MSALDTWGTLEAACPSCKAGDVEYFYFDSDCRGNSASAGATCKSCSWKTEGIPEWIREWVKAGKPVKGQKGSLL